MRILWFTEWRPPAVRARLGLPEEPGPQAWVDSLAARLVRRSSVELTIAAPSTVAFQPFAEDGVRFVGLPWPVPASRVGRIADNWRHRLMPAGTLHAAVAAVARTKPDIVHVHGTEGGLGLIAGMLPATPCVISLQGILQAYARLYFAGRSPREVARLVASREFAKGRGVVHRYLLLRREAVREAEIVRGAAFVIGRTDWDRAGLEAVNPRAVYFHCDEIMRPEFAAAHWAPEGHDGATVYTTSSALMGKGTECLFEAAAIVRSRGARPPSVRVAGVHPGSELDGIYRREAARLGVADRIVWLGRLDAAAIARELAAADAFAYPSHVDNSPNSVAEAMLVGAPIVAANVGGISTLVKDGMEGLLFPQGDAHALMTGLMRLMGDKQQAARLGAAARETALARHDPDRIATRTLEVYREVIERWSGGKKRGSGRA